MDSIGFSQVWLRNKCNLQNTKFIICLVEILTENEAVKAKLPFGTYFCRSKTKKNEFDPGIALARFDTRHYTRH